MNSRRLNRAFALACRWHELQSRKGTDIPYVSHLLGVCSIVLEHGGSEDEAIAALLHDAVEDQGGWQTFDLIEQEFGPRVARIVAGCTDSFSLSTEAWRERKEAFIERLRKADGSVRLVSAADKLHNARSILMDYRLLGEDLWERFSGGRRDGTLWYYRSLADLYTRKGPETIAVLLDDVVGRLEQLAGERTG